MKTAEDWYQEGLRHLDLSRGADSSREYDEDRRDALEAFTQAIALNAGHAAAQRERALLLSALGHPEEALDALVVAGNDQPRDPGLVLESARAMVKLGRLAEAVPLFQRALELNGEFADAAFGLADALFRLDRDEAALAAWEVALQPKFENKAFFFTRTHALLCRARTLARLARPEAFSAFQELLSNPKHLGPMSDASFYAALEEAEVGRQAYRSWLAERLDDVGAWSIAASRFSGAGCIEDALRCWERVLELTPASSRAWFGKAETFAKARRFDEAIAAYEKSLSLEPDFLGAKARLAVVRAEAERG